MRRYALLLAAGALLASGCESTMAKNDRLAAQAKELAEPKPGLKVTKRSKVVKVGRTAVLRDENGAAAVAELRNTGDAALAAVPVAVNVRDKGKRSLFRNDLAGTETSLVAAALLQPSERMFWVHDQVVVAEEPADVRFAVGADAQPAPAQLPEIEISGAKLEQDPVSGVAAVGTLENRSDVEQRELVIYAAALKGDQIVAGGRGLVPRLKVGAKAPFTIFFIGDPRGARLELAAPPTVLRSGS
jgi:hypothetical protein